MRHILINGSPKSGKSTSGAALDYLAKLLGDDARQYFSGKGEIPDLTGADRILMAFPLYVDGVPGHFLGYLEELAKKVPACAPGILVYVIVNCGFYEAKQNHVAVDIIRNWCGRTGGVWGQALLIGGGGMIADMPIGEGPLKEVGKALQTFGDAIAQGKSAPDICTKPSFPRRLYITAAHFGWRLAARRNGLKGRDIKRGLPAEEEAL